ncbi:MAG: DMT family protein [Elusimicrobiaceae bacterium]|nr:DMT family protein [Elusimicrobiaceae bacterium]
MWKPFALLILSNLFMTIAWYGHLKYKNTAVWAVVLISWGIAFFEYCLLIPANRIGNEYFSVTQLKVTQEVITLAVFAVFSTLYFHENFRWNHLAAFCLLIGAVFLTFKKW